MGELKFQINLKKLQKIVSPSPYPEEELLAILDFLLARNSRPTSVKFIGEIVGRKSGVKATHWASPRLKYLKRIGKVVLCAYGRYLIHPSMIDMIH